MKAPLRKITGIEIEKGIFNGMPIERSFELLECGHRGKNLASVNVSMYGTKSASKRRCNKCAKP